MQNFDQNASNHKNPRLALIIIGNEILSGRTKDKNTQYIAEMTGKCGIELLEVRVIPDDEGEIVTAVNALRKKYDYVFTTGGIGPTHDDITSESVAKAFEVPVICDDLAYSLLVKYYGGEENLNDGRIKMACVPKGSELILNPISAAPGFHIGNVYVMAGVPSIMQAMLDNILPKLRHGKAVLSKTVKVEVAESKVAKPLAELQKKYADIQIGSYPYMTADDYGHVGTHVVFRGINGDKIENSVGELVETLKAMEIIFEVL